MILKNIENKPQFPKTSVFNFLQIDGSDDFDVFSARTPQIQKTIRYLKTVRHDVVECGRCTSTSRVPGVCVELNV